MYEVFVIHGSEGHRDHLTSQNPINGLFDNFLEIAPPQQLEVTPMLELSFYP